MSAYSTSLILISIQDLTSWSENYDVYLAAGSAGADSDDTFSSGVWTSKYSLREAFKKSVTFFTLGGGSGSVFVTLFFQKHGLKWLNIAL